MDRVVFFFCFLISITQIIFVLFLYRNYWKKNNDSILILVKIFFYFNFTRILFNGVVVDLLRILSEGAENKKYGVSSVEILQVYILELVSNLVYFSAFTLLLIALRSKKYIQIDFKIRKQVNILIILIFLSICGLFFKSLFSNYLWLFKDALYYIGPICSTILIILGIKYKTKKWILYGIVSLIPIILITLIAGLRGTIVGIATCFILISLIELNRAQFKRVLIIGILPLLFLALIQEKLSEIKYAFAVSVANETIDLSSAKSYTNFLFNFFNDELEIQKSDEIQKSIIQEIEFRYGASSMFAVGFLRIGLRGEFVYFNPILNSFYSFLPRQLINTSKPFSGSADGTEKTMGMYVCYNEITGSDISMTDFIISGHYYWELGWVGVLLFSLIAALYNIIIIIFTRNFGYFGIALLLLSFMPFSFLPKQTVSQIIIMIPTIILPSFLLFIIVKFCCGINLKNTI